MLKIENTDIYGWEAAIRGMRNPKNSWDKSDSGLKVMNPDDVEFGYEPNYEYIVGENDLKLMQNLVKAGSDHSKFMRYIIVSFDVTAPLYWWKEMETYRVGVAENPTDIEFNSCSTMHKIHEKEFTLDDFSHEHLIDDEDITCWGGEWITPKDLLEMTIDALNGARTEFIKTKDKRYWWQMIQLLPSTYNQRRTLQLNYAVLRNMYHARKNHKLDEWRDFCEWVESLPYAKELICIGNQQ